MKGILTIGYMFIFASQVVASQFDGLIQQYAEKYRVESHLVSCIIRKESTYNPNAKNPKSSASGLAQFTNRTWVWMRNLMGEDPNLDLRFNPEESIKTLSWALSNNYHSHWSETIGGCYVAPVKQGSSAASDQKVPKKRSPELGPIWDNSQVWCKDKEPSRCWVQYCDGTKVTGNI